MIARWRRKKERRFAVRYNLHEDIGMLKKGWRCLKKLHDSKNNQWAWIALEFRGRKRREVSRKLQRKREGDEEKKIWRKRKHKLLKITPTCLKINEGKVKALRKQLWWSQWEENLEDKKVRVIEGKHQLVWKETRGGRKVWARNNSWTIK